MTNIRYSHFALGGSIMLIAAMMCLPKAANAIPAYANRLGVPCSTCHEPVFSRLTRFGLLFRELGYRTEAEMNTTIGPLAPSDANKYQIGDTISVANTDRYDNVQQQGLPAQQAFYYSSINLYFSGPANENFGYWVQTSFPTQSFSETASKNGYALTTGTTVSAQPYLRYYSGKSADSFLFARVGNVSVEGFQGNNGTLASDATTLLTKSINSSTATASGTGGELGYALKDDVLTAYVTEPSTTDSHTSTNEALQYLHLLGTHDSSFQAIYSTGRAPLTPSFSFTSSANLSQTLPSSTNPNAWNSYNQILLYANYRKPVSDNDFTNILLGYSSGTNHLLTSSTVSGTPAWYTEKVQSIGPSFNTRAFYAEFEYQKGWRLVPYIRYDNFHSDQPVSNVTGINEYTAGMAYLIDQNIKLNVDYNSTDTTGGTAGTTNTVRTQLAFIW